MKVRVGFVSNSSSSSFLIVGTQDSSIIKAVAQKLGKYDLANNKFTVECSYGYKTTEHFNFYGGYDPEYLGLDVSKKIKTKPYSELVKEFQDTLKKNYDIEIHASDIDLHFGECGDD